MTDEQESKIGRMDVSIGPREATSRTEIPLRIIVLGDFTPETPEVEDWSGASRLVKVTPASFGSVMRQMEPRLSLEVPNRISEHPKELEIKLHFPDMRAFSPEGVAEQVDELAALLEIRRLVSQVRDRKLTLQEFNEQARQTGIDAAWLERFHQMLSRPRAQEEPEPPEAPPEPTPAQKQEGGILDSILTGLDSDSERVEPTETERSPIDNLLRAVSKSKSGPAADRSILDTVIGELDQTFSEQVNDILHHSKFQQLESTWRGLRFLVDRADFRENIQLELLAVRNTELRDAIYHQVFNPEYNEVTEAPLSVMISDHEFGQTPEDVQLLEDIAQMSASIQVPFIASVSLAFFGVQTGEELADLPMLRSFFKRAEYAQWGALRDKEDSQYIALTMPHFLLRYSYSPDGTQSKGFDFTERAESPSDQLWGRGAFAVAAAVVRSFAEDGWCVNITGLRGGGLLENLPVWTHHIAGRDIQIPLEVLLTQSREREFMDNGFVLLSSQVNDNRICILGAPTIYRPRKYADPKENEQARLHATLPYQLFATRVSHYLRRIVRDVSTGLTIEGLQREITGKMRMALAKTGRDLSPDAVMVEVTESQEKPDYYTVSLRIRPPFQIMGRNVDLILGLQLHR